MNSADNNAEDPNRAVDIVRVEDLARNALDIARELRAEVDGVRSDLARNVNAAATSIELACHATRQVAQEAWSGRIGGGS